MVFVGVTTWASFNAYFWLPQGILYRLRGVSEGSRSGSSCSEAGAELRLAVVFSVHDRRHGTELCFISEQIERFAKDYWIIELYSQRVSQLSVFFCIRIFCEITRFHASTIGRERVSVSMSRLTTNMGLSTLL
jgi:hypothetical protein